MAEDDTNGILIQGDTGQQTIDESTLYDVLNRLFSTIFFPDPDSDYASAPLLQRIKASLSVNIPLLCDASRNTGLRALLWTRRGGTFRALLVVSAGTIAVVTLTGLLVFMLFFFAATFNAVVISLLVSLAAAGGCLTLFFAFVAAIYFGALSVALFIISTAAISSVIAVLFATGWIGFILTLWLVAKKSIGVAKYSLLVTCSAVSAYSTAAWHSPNQNVSKKSD
ncbi:uncharacterized protein [Primulina eburnea]|uniref:uncharacterized protein n=1 Tax=Primulina eburnea TaxID=1245227 RepID=UPI003C6C0DD8